MPVTVPRSGPDRVEIRGPEDFRPLVQQLSGPLWGLAMDIVRDPGAAQDVVQQAWIRLWQARERLPHTPGELQSYASRVVINLANNALRDRAVRGRYEETAAERWEQRPAPAGPAESLELRELWQLVDALPPDQRDVLLLRFGIGLTLPEVADALGASRATVARRQAQGLEQLRERLSPTVAASVALTAGALATLLDRSRVQPAPHPPSVSAMEVMVMAGIGAKSTKGVVVTLVLLLLVGAASVVMAPPTSGTGAPPGAPPGDQPVRQLALPDGTDRVSSSLDSGRADDLRHRSLVSDRQDTAPAGPVPTASAHTGSSEITGRVLDPDGRPISGARVSLTDEEPANGSTTDQPQQFATESDDGGHYRFQGVPRGSWRLTARRGWSTLTHVTSVEEARVADAVSMAVTLSAPVHRQDLRSPGWCGIIELETAIVPDRPVQDVTIKLLGTDGVELRLPTWFAITLHPGVTYIGGVPPGDWVLQATAPHGFAAQRLPINGVRHGSRITVCLAIELEGALTIRALTADGEPLEYAAATCLGIDAQRGTVVTRSDSTGEDGLAVLYGVGGGTVYARIDHPVYGTSDAVRVELPREEPVDIRIAPRCAVSGRVSLDAGVNALPTHIGFDAADGGLAPAVGEQRQWARVGDDGTFEATGLRPGRYRLAVRLPAEAGIHPPEVGITPATIEVVAQQDWLYLSLSRGPEMTGTVRQVNGDPVAGARVALYPLDYKLESGHSEAVTDASGHYRVAVQSPGNFLLAVKAPDSSHYLSERVMVRPGMQRDVVLPLDGLTVELVTPDGKPLSAEQSRRYEMTVLDVDRARRLQYGYARVSGSTAVFPMIAPGRYRLVALLGNGNEVVQEVTVPVGGGRMRMVIPSTGSLAIEAQWPEDLASIRCYVRRMDGAYDTLGTRVELIGPARVDGLSPGAYQLRFVGPEENPTTMDPPWVDVTVRGGETTPVAVTVEPVPGMIVLGVKPGSAADAAGLRAGDRIVSVADLPVAPLVGTVDGASAVVEMLACLPDGPASVPIRFWRDGQEHTVHATVPPQGVVFGINPAYRRAE